MNWTIGGGRIFISDSKEEANQIVPRLQPLTGPTILQVFGYESDVRTIAGIVVGNVDRDALKVLRTTGNGYTLQSPEGVVGTDFIVKGISISRMSSICQTMRPDLDSDAPVYKVEIQLYDQ